MPIDCLGDCTPYPVDFAELIETGKVVPGDGDAEGSKLLRRLRDDSMPPPSSLQPLLSERP